ncbi:MAG: flavodoxin family protein [Candidatus Methanomethylophilaceae archaeon]|jgi:multimeric flavodoxin WrbA
MKVVALNGSPRLIGNTSNALNVVLDELEKEGIETEYIQLYEDHMNPCNHCSSCEVRGDGRCINEDDGMNGYLEKLHSADGIILASPTYYGSCTAQLKMFLERAGLCAMTGGNVLKGKVGAVIVVQERDGGTMVYSELVNWMLANQMVVVGSTPLSVVNGKNPMDYEKDIRGMKALKELGKNLADVIQRFSRQ